MLIDDKLTNKDAITVLRNLQDWLYLSGINGGTSIQREAIDIAIKALEAEPHWIPVAERLPEVSGCYLVSVKNDHKRGYSKTAWFEKGAWFARQDVIAWMPLPESFKG